MRKELKESSGTSDGKRRGKKDFSGKEKNSSGEGINSEKPEIFGNLKEAGKIFKTRKLQKISVTPEEFDAIKYLMIRDKVGMGLLEPLLRDSNIEDISCSGLGRIFVEHKVFSSLKTTISFEEIEELNSFVIQISEKVGKPITYRDPIVDTALPDGSRINIVFGEDVSKRGSNFTIRKFMEVPISILELIEFGTIDYTMAAYMWMMLRAGMNCFVSGETASGKTTTMNAVTTFLPPESKIVSIEDTPELQVPHKNWTREVTRTTRDDSGSDVSMFDLLKAALRQRPNEIMIGEIRG
ncbi:type II/IV secretion system ATPase subunit [Methanosarcina horonobensis]|uniref:type II/IV secretion system ATPase subunit n=1 Tax=Methanosarcina horonobensis TaxID=418008 RepID=UPI000AECB2B5|nr:type II/IV secretion system ATPase subunit [Methanosarcina horonobensis]